MKAYVTLPEAWHADPDRVTAWIGRAAAWFSQMPEKVAKPKAKKSKP